MPDSGTATKWGNELFGEGRRGEILRAASEVFVERGYSDGSMRDIATRVGVTEPALYRHFASKEDLFVALVRLAAARVMTETSALIDDLAPSDLRECVLQGLARRRRVFAQMTPLLRAIFAAAAYNPVFLEVLRGEVAEPLLSHVAAKTLELDAAFAVPNAGQTRASRVRGLMALISGSAITSLVLGDEPDAATADAALTIMGWMKR